MMSTIGSLNGRDPIMTSDNKIKPKESGWEIDIRGEKEDLTWLL